MRNKRLWKNLMLATVCTVALGTTSVPVLAADVNPEAGTAIEVEAEVETAEIEKEEAVEEAVPTPAPQTEVEAEEDKAEVAEKEEVTGEITKVNFPTAVDGVITLTDADFSVLNGTVYTTVPIEVHVTSASGNYEKLGVESIAGNFGMINPQDFENDGIYTGGVYIIKEDIVEAGGTKTYNTTLALRYIDENYISHELDTIDYSVTVKYVSGSIETPDPENPDSGNVDNGNTEAPETPNGNTDNGNTETPNGDNTNNDAQTPDTQTPNNDPVVQPVTTTKTSPKTGDMAAVLPVLGTGLSSLGIAVASILRKRK